MIVNNFPLVGQAAMKSTYMDNQSKSEPTKNMAARTLDWALSGVAVFLTISCIWGFCGLERANPFASGVTYDLVYDRNFPECCSGDIYVQTRGDRSLAPAVILVHSGDRNAKSKLAGTPSPLISRLLEAGFVVFDIDCRAKNSSASYASDAAHVKEAFHYFANVATRYGASADDITVIGSSTETTVQALTAYAEDLGDTRPTAIMAIGTRGLWKLNNVKDQRELQTSESRFATWERL